MRASWISRVGVGSAAASLLFLSTAGLLGGTVAAAPPPPPDLLPAHASVVSPSVLAHSQKLHAVNLRQSWTVGLVLPSKNPRGLETYAQEVSTPGSAVYRHFLSHQHMVAAYGPSAAVVSTIETYLAQHGLKFRLVGQILDVTGSVAQINQLFASTLGQYQHGSQEFVAPAGAITIPDALRVAAGIDGLTTSTVAPLSNFRKASQVTGLFHAIGADQLGPRPTGLTSTVSSDGLTVSVQLLTPVQTVGLGAHYLVTGRLNGAPDQGLTLVQVGGQLKGGVPGFLTTVTNVNGQFELDFSLSQAQKTDLNIEVATVLPTTGAIVGPVITVPLPVATFKGAAANVCSSTLFGPTPKGQEPFPILCPWNPRS
ncbi:MAG: protease pro-enzyme activation domain-containing protein, partial [Clostridia bacterium]